MADSTPVILSEAQVAELLRRLRYAEVTLRWVQEQLFRHAPDQELAAIGYTNRYFEQWGDDQVQDVGTHGWRLRSVSPQAFTVPPRVPWCRCELCQEKAE